MNTGNFWVMRQKRAAGRWAVAGVVEFEPSWIVRFSLPGQKPRTESSRLGICEACLAVAPERNPARERTGCRCLRPVMQWAEAKLGAMSRLWQAGRMEELATMARPRAAAAEVVVAVTVGNLVDAYEAGMPERMRGTCQDNVAALKTILCQVSGLTWVQCRAQAVTWLTRELALDWMRLRQVWNGERSLPEKRRREWPALRAALARAKEGTAGLPGLVSNLPLEGNYTINSEYGKARSVMGRKARSYYLGNLVLPVLTFGEVSRLASSPGQQVRLGGAAIEGLLALGARWRTEDVAKWIAFRLMAGCGLRSREVLWAHRDWLQEGEWLEEGGSWRGWALVVRNYPEQAPLNAGGKVDGLPGFWQKGAMADKVRTFRVEGDLLAVLLEREGLLFAPDRSYTGRRDLLGRDISKALRPWVGEDNKGTNHQLRKLSVSTVADGQGMDAAAAHGGHTLEVAQQFYARSRMALRVVTDAELRGSAAAG